MFQRDLLLIQAHYWDRGYVQVKVANPLVELSPDKQSMYITISIEEGPQYRLGKVDVTGELLAPREVLPRSACRSRPARSSTGRSCPTTCRS